MTTYNGLPLYRVALAEDDGVLRVSLVDSPAVESDFEVFRKAEAERPALYSVQDEDKHLVRGVILRADFPIYRNDGRGGYYVTFSPAVIREAAERYIADGRANAVDTDHDGKEVDGVQMVQLFIKDAAAGMAPEGFDDIADGSLFGEYHVTDPDIWDEIKAGTWKGFSVEIFYKLIPAAEPMAAAEKKNKFSANMKNLLADIMSAVTRVLAKYGSVTTDKGVIYWDGDEDLKAGDRVEVENAEGQREAAADGDYTTPDGKVIVIVDGAVAEVKDSEAEVASDESEKAEEAAEESPEQMAKARAEKFTASYSEKMQAIHDAVMAGLSGDNYCYVIDAGDDFALVEEYGEATEWRDKLYRYAVRWDGETPVVSDKRAAKYAAVPDELDTETLWNGAPAEGEDKEAEMAAIRSEAESFKAENETLKARIAELEKTPAGKPAQEQFKAEGNDAPEVDGLVIRDKGLARLARHK